MADSRSVFSLFIQAWLGMVSSLFNQAVEQPVERFLSADNL